MHTTETKPRAAVLEETGAEASLRLVFAGERIVDQPRTVPVAAVGTAIGRAPGRAGFEIEDARASRHHVTVHRTGGRLWIVDAKSRNGTRVNGVGVDRADLSPGDVISLGDSCFVVAEDPHALADATIDGMHGDSVLMRRARGEILHAARTSATVLFEAESGCGKELAARAVNRASGARGKLVSVNCAAVPENPSSRASSSDTRAEHSLAPRSMRDSSVRPSRVRCFSMRSESSLSLFSPSSCEPWMSGR